MLKKWRLRRGWSQRRLAAEIGRRGRRITHVSLGRIERGEQQPSLQLMRVIAEVTGGAVLPNHFAGIGGAGQDAGGGAEKVA